MEIATPAINAALVVAMTIVITWYMSGRFRAIEKRLDEHDKALATLSLHATKEDLATIERRILEQTREIVALRSDLTHVALAVGARTRPATG
jgi:hypothetical protein